MLVHVHLPDSGEHVLTSCPQCDAPLPVRVTSFLQCWYVGQVCLRCRSTGWILGCYETPIWLRRCSSTSCLKPSGSLTSELISTPEHFHQASFEPPCLSRPPVPTYATYLHVQDECPQTFIQSAGQQRPMCLGIAVPIGRPW